MQHLREPIGPVKNATKSQHHKITKTNKEAKTSNYFTTSHCSRHYNYRCYLPKLQTVTLSATKHQRVFLIKGLRRHDNIKKTKNRTSKCKNTFLFLKTINFTVINVIRYQLESFKCSFISPQKTIKKLHNPMFNCATFQSQWDLL